MSKTIAFYVDGIDLWATDRDPEQGAYAVRLLDEGAFANIFGYGRGSGQSNLSDIDTRYVTDPADLAAQAFAWLAINDEDGTTFLTIDPDVVVRHPAAVQFLTGVPLDGLALSIGGLL